MKDLRHYITNRNVYKRNIDFPIDVNTNSILEFMSFCIFNSFQKEENCIDGLIQLQRNEEFFSLSFDEYDQAALEDFNISTDFVRKTVLNAMLPKYSYEDISAYFDSDDLNNEDAEDTFEGINSFFEYNKIPKKENIRWIKEYASEGAKFYAFTIKSRYLISIYKNKKLRKLFEEAVSATFLKPTLCYCAWINYVDDWAETRHADISSTIKFIKEYKKVFPKKRKYRDNYAFANQVLNLDIYPTTQSLITDILNNFLTNTEVMF